MEAEARNDFIDSLKDKGRPYGNVGYRINKTGTVAYLGGLNLEIPVQGICDYDAVFKFLTQYSELFGVKNPNYNFVVDKISESENGSHFHMVQYLNQYIVFGSKIVVHVNNNGTIGGFSGVYLPDRLFPAENTLVKNDANATTGLFHGSIFGLDGWDDRVAVATNRITTFSNDTRPVIQYGSIEDGSVVHETPAYILDAPADIYHSPNGEDYPGLPIRLDSTQQCGTGTWPSCQYSGTSFTTWFWTTYFGIYLNDRFSRDSWNDGHTVSECDGTNYHPLEVTSDFNHYGSWNAAWVGGLCSVVMGSEASVCPDILGHEFGHGIQMADMGLIPQQAEHSAAIAEGLADVIGEFFEEWLYGTDVDWKQGTGAGFTWTRNLADPHNSQDVYGYPEYLPEHASEWDPPINLQNTDHFDATIVGKAAHLLGRTMAEGSTTHWGIPVTGIGGSNAAIIFQGAISNYLTSTPTFTDLREALLDAAEDEFDSVSTEYSQTRATVDAMGYWTPQYQLGFVSDELPSDAQFTVNGITRRYLFTVEDGSLKYRYRTCAYYSTCSWSSPVSISAASGGVSAVVYDGTLWVFWTYNNSIKYKRFFSDGSSSSISTRSGASTSDAPVALYVPSGNLVLFYRELADLSVESTVKMMKYNGSSWTSATSTDVETRSPFSAVYVQGNIHVFYKTSGLATKFRIFNWTTQVWSSAYDVCNPYYITNLDDEYGPSVEYYRGRLHVTVPHKGTTLSTQYGTLYASCEYPCTDEDWTPFTYPDGDGNARAEWQYIFSRDSHLTLFEKTVAHGSTPELMNWRWKNSE